MWTCKHCKKEFDFSRSPIDTSKKANHSKWCEKNPKRQCYLDILQKARKVNSSKPSPRKGQTKENSDIVRRQAATYKQRVKDGKIIPYNRGKAKTEEQKEKIRQAVNEKISNGEWHTGAGRAKKNTYKGIKLHSSWELKYAKWLDVRGIRWRRPKESFVYEFEGKERRYTPDFFLIDEHCYIEIKGYKTPKDEAKWSQFPL